MKPIGRKNNIKLVSSLLALVVVQSASAAPANLYEGFYSDPGHSSGLHTWGTSVQLYSSTASVSIVSTSPGGSDRTVGDGGVSIMGKPISLVIGDGSEASSGTFEIWDENSYISGEEYFPLFQIDATTGNATYKNVDVLISNGSLSVTGGLNLTGNSGNGISVNGSPIFSIDGTGKVNYASNKPVSIASTTVSSSSSTGSLTVGGGIGALKDSHINGLRIGRGAGDLAWNTAVGSGTLAANTTGNLLTAFGYNALAANTTGNINTAFGGFALAANTTGTYNTAFGSSTLQFANGSYNTAVGAKALNQGGAIYYNTAVGTSSLYKNTSNNNAAFGNSSLYENTSGSLNTGLGTNALFANVDGWSNVGVGSAAGYSTSSGSGNVFVGTSAGQYQGSGTAPLAATSNSIYIGYQARGFNNSDNNSIVIGANAVGEGANTTVIGNGSTTRTRLHGTTEVSSLSAPAGIDPLVVKGRVILEIPQGDISMGIYE